MATRIRKNVWSLAQDDPTIVWYRAAVAELKKRPITDPTSWRYLAAVHDYPGQVPASAAQYWQQCQHQSWFFLPWHRGYLASFEAIIAKTILSLNGPADWALPYWDYSDRTNPNARIMPAAFFNRVLPNNQENDLWSTRNDVQNGNFGFDNGNVSLEALNNTKFSGVPSFGGPETGFHGGGGTNGGLELAPHNSVHWRIGGFMGHPVTAGLDPIFWLHHCNIDRLWEVWRNKTGKKADPTSPQWLTAVPFPMHDGDGKPFSFVAAEMLDTTKVLHGYQYDNVPVAKPQPKVGVVEVAMADEEEPELVGSTSAATPLTGKTTKTTISLKPSFARRSFADAQKPDPDHVYLKLENVVGKGMPGDYDVYIDLPGDQLAPELAGVLTTFGIDRASNATAHHGGSGIGLIFEITHLAKRLKLDQSNIAQLQITFERKDQPPIVATAPKGLEEYLEPLKVAPEVTVGKVSLLYG